MTSITYLKGDATAPAGSGAKIICHVCNDVGGWGKGFVLAISKRWPEPGTRYRAWHKQGVPGGFRFGAIQLVEVEPALAVANMVAQRGIRPTRGLPPIRYDALRDCLASLAERAPRSAPPFTCLALAAALREAPGRRSSASSARRFWRPPFRFTSTILDRMIRKANTFSEADACSILSHVPL